MARIFFVRHGESTANAGGVTMEHASIPLSPLGLVQAREIAGLLDVDPSRVLVSKYLRARETAQLFCERAGCVPEVHPLLHEFSALDPSLLEGMIGEQRRPIAAAYWQTADPTVRRGPQAETFLEFDARVAVFIDELPTLSDRTVLFGHGIWFGLLCWKLMGFSADSSQGMKAFRRFQTGLPMPNCAVYVLHGLDTRNWGWRANEASMRQIATINLD